MSRQVQTSVNVIARICGGGERADSADSPGSAVRAADTGAGSSVTEAAAATETKMIHSLKAHKRH